LISTHFFLQFCDERDIIENEAERELTKRRQEMMIAMWLFILAMLFDISISLRRLNKNIIELQKKN